MGEGAATVSERGVILFANPQLASFLGVDRDSMIGRDLTAYVGEAPARRSWPTCSIAEADGDPTRPSSRSIDADGRPRSRSSSPPPTSTSTASLVRCLVLTDLTMQKQIEQQLARRSAAQAERQRVAREVNDTIVQGLVTAEMALDLEQVRLRPRRDRQHLARRPGAGSASSPATTRLEPGMAVRSAPARRQSGAAMTRERSTSSSSTTPPTCAS